MTPDNLRRIVLEQAKLYIGQKGNGIAGWAKVHHVSLQSLSMFMAGKRGPPTALLKALRLKWTIASLGPEEQPTPVDPLLEEARQMARERTFFDEIDLATVDCLHEGLKRGWAMAILRFGLSNPDGPDAAELIGRLMAENERWHTAYEIAFDQATENGSRLSLAKAENDAARIAGEKAGAERERAKIVAGPVQKGLSMTITDADRKAADDWMDNPKLQRTFGVRKSLAEAFAAHRIASITARK